MSTSRRRSSRNVVEPLESRTLLAAPDLDYSFSGDGFVTTNFSGGFDNARAVAVQKDGKIIVAGEAGSLGLAAVRYNADGTLDDGGPNDSTPGDRFGTNGKFTYAQDSSSGATAVAIQKDGKIILAGTAFAGSQQYWLLLRLNVDGSFDKTFGSNHDGKAGIVFSIDSTPLTGIALQNDGKIVVCGTMNDDFLVGRFTTKGELDDTFNPDDTPGDVTVDFGGVDQAAGLAIDGLGNIVVVGSAGGDGLNQNVGLARIQSNGTLDPNFAQSGKLLLDRKKARLDVVGVGVGGDSSIQVGWSEFDLSGHWSPSFETVTPSGQDRAGLFFSDNHLNALTIMPNGRVAAAETSAKTPSAMAALVGGSTNTGQLVYGFDATGSTAIAAAADGSIFQAGFADHDGRRDFLLVKLVGINPKTWGAISGSVFRDTDGDRVQDPNENGIGNVHLFIDGDKNGVWDSGYPEEPSAYTDASGNFVFRGLDPATYTIAEVVPGGTTRELPTAGSYTVTVSGGKTAKGLIFANKPSSAATTQTAINGSVFNDWNSNAKRDISKPTEPDLANIVVFIDSNKNGKLDSKETQTKTDAGGNYSLNLSRGGTYRVAVAIPSGWINTTPAFYDVKVTTHAQATERFGLTFNDVNDTIAEVKTAAPIALGKTIAGSLGSDVDVNLYRIVVAANQTLGFDLDAASGSSIDSYFRLFDATGKQLASNDNAAAPGEGAGVDSYLKYTFSKAGTNYLAVSDHLNTAYSVTTGDGDIGSGTKGKYSLLIKPL